MQRFISALSLDCHSFLCHCRTYVSGSMPDSESAVLVAPSSPVPTIDGRQVDNFPSLMLRPSQKCTAILERKKVVFEAGVLTR